MQTVSPVISRRAKQEVAKQLPEVLELLSHARNGGALEPEERRMLFEYLRYEHPEPMSRVEMARILGVSKVTLHKYDRELCEHLYNDVAFGDRVKVMVGKILADYERSVAVLHKSMNAAPHGSREKVEHLRELRELQEALIEMLTKLGYVEKVPERVEMRIVGPGGLVKAILMEQAQKEAIEGELVKANGNGHTQEETPQESAPELSVNVQEEDLQTAFGAEYQPASNQDLNATPYNEPT